MNSRMRRSARLAREVFWRDPGELEPLWWHIAVNTIVASTIVPARLRTLAFRLLGVDMAISALCRPGQSIRTRRLTIGAGTTINLHCVFDNRVLVRIGANVGVGVGVRFITSDHRIDDPLARAGTSTLGEIRVEDGAYVGTGATVLSGVTIGEGAVVAAGAIVVSDCEPHGLYAGVPARRIRDLIR